jgi:hypothetical protein
MRRRWARAPTSRCTSQRSELLGLRRLALGVRQSRLPLPEGRRDARHQRGIDAERDGQHHERALDAHVHAALARRGEEQRVAPHARHADADRPTQIEQQRCQRDLDGCVTLTQAPGLLQSESASPTTSPSGPGDGAPAEACCTALRSRPALLFTGANQTLAARGAGAGSASAGSGAELFRATSRIALLV